VTAACGLSPRRIRKNNDSTISSIIVFVLNVPEKITTSRLILRRPLLSDADAVFEFGRDQEVTLYMDWPAHTSVQAAKEYLRDCVPRWDTAQEYDWMIALRDTGQVIGGISIRVRGHSADFGYILNRDFWGRGFATEAANAVVNWVFGIGSIYRVWATCDTENLASVRVLEKVGLTREGILRCWAIRPNISPKPRDAYVYSKVRGSGDVHPPESRN
jgi:RimJ/RimL family protein N-acetyltransferase